MTQSPRSPSAAAIAAFLRSHPIALGLDASQLGTLVAAAESRYFLVGESLLKQGATNRDLFVIYSGAADVFKRDEGDDREHVVNTVGPGTVLGEMSLFQNELASASVRATEPTIALVLPGRVLSRNRLGSAFDALRGNIGESSTDRQRLTTSRYVDSLREALRRETERREFGVLVSVIVILVGIDHAVAGLSDRTGAAISSPSFSWGALLSFAVLLIYFVWRTSQPVQVFGLTMEGSRRAVRESLAISVPLVAMAIAAKFGFMRAGLIDEQPIFVTHTLYSSALFFPGIAGVIASRVLGFMHHALQELLMRGVVQGSLYRLYGRDSAALAIVATSVIFATAHLFIGVPLALMTFAGGLLFGWLYARHRTLVGVTLLHFIVHTTMKFLGFV